MLTEARHFGYGIAAINVSNMETILAILSAADRLDQPVILQVSPMQKQAQGFEYCDIVMMIDMLATHFDHGEYSIHLDHCETVEECILASGAGFDSVMLDKSHEAIDINISEVGRLRKALPSVCVEAELGCVGGAEGTGEGNGMIFTDPAVASDFVEKTGSDCLAVSIGNAHGFYRSEPALRFDLLKQIADQTEVPLVLHGASGISPEDLRKAVEFGISKINFFTTLDHAFCSGLRDALKEKQMMMFVQKAAQCKMQETAETLINICSGGRKNA